MIPADHLMHCTHTLKLVE